MVLIVVFIFVLMLPVGDICEVQQPKSIDNLFVTKSRWQGCTMRKLVYIIPLITGWLTLLLLLKLKFNIQAEVINPLNQDISSPEHHELYCWTNTERSAQWIKETPSRFAIHSLILLFQTETEWRSCPFIEWLIQEKLGAREVHPVLSSETIIQFI